MADSDLPVTWDHVYLLGWYDENRRPYLTTWDGDLPYIDVVIKGLSNTWQSWYGMPLWDAPAPPRATLVRVPAGVDPHDFARQEGGIYAFGWHVLKPIIRRNPDAHQS